MIYEFSRTELLLGEDGMKKLQKATVMVFGVGGVGSHCIESLARSGVGHLIIVDNDTVSLSNINRQSIAYHSTVGRYKTHLMKERIQDICPSIVVETMESFVLPDNIQDVVPEGVDYLIDAIDTVSAKIAIVELARERNIPLISSMGTGNKLHPELFQIADISKTSMCPLCKVMRKELKNRGIYKLKVLFSKEKPINIAGRETGEDKGKRRALPGSISFTPPVAGLLISAEVIREISGVS